jgi:protein-tyrosine phosphatase
VPFADVHCHPLWAVDDGPRTADEAVRLCRELAARGFDDVAATAHAWPELPDAVQTAARRAELQALLAAQGVPLRLHAGAENRLDGELLERVARGDARPLGAGNWVLVEAPHRLPLPGMAELCFRLQISGLRVAVAHPERCRAFHDDQGLAARLSQAGCALQVELGSLAGAYGRAPARLARELLDAGLVSLAASDLHTAGAAGRLLDEGLAAMHKAVGHKAMQLLLDDHPRRVLRGEPLG